MKTLIIIPSRLSAKRLPGKPLLKINGLSMISHVFKKAQDANIGEVFVAAEDQEIVDDVKKNGGEAILTSKNNQMINYGYDFGTLASKINEKKIFENEDIVKVITDKSLDLSQFPLALKFLRKSDANKKNIYHHLGIYCYNLKTLKKFISLKQTSNEIKNRLEQLRALENNININVALAKSTSIGVDTEEDFIAIKKIMEYKS